MAVESDSHKLRLWFPALRYGCPSVNIERPLSHAANYRIGHPPAIQNQPTTGSIACPR